MTDVEFEQMLSFCPQGNKGKLPPLRDIVFAYFRSNNELTKQFTDQLYEKFVHQKA